MNFICGVKSEYLRTCGCLFGVDFKWGLGFLLAAGVWAYKVRECKPSEVCCMGGNKRC